MNTDTQVTEDAVIDPPKDIAASFNSEMEKLGLDPRTGEARNPEFEEANDVTITTTPPKKETKGSEKTATEIQKESTDGIPDEILMGKKEKAPEVDPFTAEPPAELKGKSREHFKNLQVQSGQKITHLEAELARRDQAIAEFKKNGNVAGEDTIKELETLRQTRAELEAELERVAVERSPKFKEKYLSREQGLKSKAIAILKAAGADSDLFEQSIHLTDKNKFDFESEELSDAHKSTLRSLMVQYDLVQDEKKAALENSKEFVKEYQSEQEKKHAEQLKAREHAETQVFETIGKRVSAEFEPFIEVEGNEAWNTQVKQNREMARKFFNGEASLEELAEVAHYGIGAKSLHKMFKSLQGKYNELVASHGKVIASNPTINGSHEVKETPKNESAEDRRMRVFREEMSAVQNQG